MIHFNRVTKFQLHNLILKELYLTRLYSTNKKNSTTFVSRLDKLKFSLVNDRKSILLQKRNLNQDTNAAGVWDPFPGNSC
jgi:hypothetical protein